MELLPGSEALGYRYVRIDLKAVDLGFAGRHRSHNEVHRAIAALAPGDPLETRVADRGIWELLDGTGRVVGRLAKSFTPPAGMRCRSAEVMAVVGWSREGSDPQYRDSIKCDTWEVIVPEFVFEPAIENTRHDGAMARSW